MKDQHRTPTAPRDSFNVQRPSPTAGYQRPGNRAPNDSPPGFRPQMGEGNAAARSRVIDTARAIARGNGQAPADNG